MKIAILHQDLEKSELDIKKALEKQGYTCELVDVRNAKADELKEYNLVLNRVYASVANRNYLDNIRTINLLSELEKQGVPCINGLETTRADYSKYSAYLALKKAGVATPETIFIKELKELKRAINFSRKHNFNIIIKRDMGGRGIGLKKCETEQQITEYLKEVLSKEQKKIYDAGWVLQPLLRSSKSHDARICITNNQVSYAFGRTLVNDSSNNPWLASISLGSKEITYTPSSEEYELALKATKAIGAFFNIVDMYFTKEGPVIIENNCTPQFGQRKGKTQKMSSVIKEILKHENISNTKSASA